MEYWRHKISLGNFAMLETVSYVTEECDGAKQTSIIEHLAASELELTIYFPEISSQTPWPLRDPFTAPVTSIPDKNYAFQTELLGLREDSGAKMKFDTESLTVFLSTMAATYPNLCDLAFRHFLPFTYHCDVAFSDFLHVKTKFSNRLPVAHGIRCKLAVTKPRIKKLVDVMQHHPSH